MSHDLGQAAVMGGCLRCVLGVLPVNVSQKIRVVSPGFCARCPVPPAGHHLSETLSHGPGRVQREDENQVLERVQPDAE